MCTAGSNHPCRAENAIFGKEFEIAVRVNQVGLQRRTAAVTTQ
jgi:hypothetical protein